MKITTIQEVYRNLPRLETLRLILRSATQDDVSDIFAYASDADVTRYLRWGPHLTINDTERYVADVLQEYSKGENGPWLIEDKRTRTAIGHIHLMEISIRHQKAEVGFVLSKSYWDQGIMTEALGKVLEYCFAEIGLNRIEGQCIVQNRAAARVMEKAGMRKEGEVRSYAFQKGRFWDFEIYSILKAELSPSARNDRER